MIRRGGKRKRRILLDKSELPIGPNTARMDRPETRFRSKPHRDWIGALPCLICGRIGPVAAAHIRLGNDGAAGVKPSDFFTVPLCDSHLGGFAFDGCHDIQHSMGEGPFWALYGGVDRARETALDFAAKSPCPDAREAARLFRATGCWAAPGDAPAIDPAQRPKLDQRNFR